eukprot:7573309-Prorocentrum_lima.AAC.1
MAARVDRMKQQLKDGAVAGAASTLRQAEGVAMDPRHAAELQALFPTQEPRPATPAAAAGPWEEAFAFAYAAHLPKAINGLRRSGAAGLDGWRPAHVKILAKDGQ